VLSFSFALALSSPSIMLLDPEPSSLLILTIAFTRLCASELDYGEKHDEGALIPQSWFMNGPTIVDGGWAWS
jgi:hypothetical protein